MMRTRGVERPTSLEAAAETLREFGPRARLVAGGTDLVTHLRRGEPAPALWIDLMAVPGDHLRRIRRDGDRVVIGCLTSFQAMAESQLIGETLPALQQAARIMGSVQIRARATLGGNIANASPAGDSLPPLMVADSLVRATSPRGMRELPLEELIVGPGKTCLAPDEIIAGVSYPVVEGARSVYERIGTRHAHEISKVGVAVRAVITGQERLEQVRISLGSVAPTPIRALEAEQVLEGAVASDVRIERAAVAAGEAARPIDDIRSTASYRSDMCEELVRDLLHHLLSEAQG